MAVGIGFDLHRLEKGRKMVLGGVSIDFDKGPVGHSDGDALLHAVIDALLGAAGWGDIGEWFPDTDEKFRGADSATLVGEVKKQIEKAWTIVNLDVNVMLERPKLGPVKKKIQARIAALLGVKESQVNVKAKTLEGLGDIGRGDAVAAQAVVELRAR